MSDLVEKVAKVIQYHGHPNSRVRAKAAIKVVADALQVGFDEGRTDYIYASSWLRSQLEET